MKNSVQVQFKLGGAGSGDILENKYTENHMMMHCCQNRGFHHVVV